MSDSKIVLVAIELDSDHVPETNGRMSVCRRCGVRTDSPTGIHHVLDERQLGRSEDWLRMESQRRRVRRFQGQMS